MAQTITYEKTYGIKPVVLRRPRSIAGKQRYCVVSDNWEHIDLNFASPEFAMQKAELFTKSCYKDFVDFKGNQVKFTFKKV